MVKGDSTRLRKFEALERRVESSRAHGIPLGSKIAVVGDFGPRPWTARTFASDRVARE